MLSIPTEQRSKNHIESLINNCFSAILPVHSAGPAIQAGRRTGDHGTAAPFN
jgi:dTDP-4-amino-4,6-dideoxygalactose transaminase